MSRNNLSIKVALVGAGAIAQRAYFPILADVPGLALEAVVDPSDAVNGEVASRFHLGYAGPNLDAAIPFVDAVIICTPNHLHYPIAKTCLENGKHVLCEKPLTVKPDDSKKLLDLAWAKGLILTIAHVRRFYPAVLKIKKIIDQKTLGALIGFDFREGTVFSWQTVSGFSFDKQKSGGGVLMDIGVHVLDLLFWWINDNIASLHYMDDSLGGLEATTDIHLRFHNGISGHIKLSRLAVLKNGYTFHFEKGDLYWNPFIPHRLYIQKKGQPISSKKVDKGRPMKALLEDFSSAVITGHPPFIRGDEALRSIQFIQSCYATRQGIPMPWLYGTRPQCD